MLYEITIDKDMINIKGTNIKIRRRLPSMDAKKVITNGNDNMRLIKIIPGLIK